MTPEEIYNKKYPAGMIEDRYTELQIFVDALESTKEQVLQYHREEDSEYLRGISDTYDKTIVACERYIQMQRSGLGSAFGKLLKMMDDEKGLGDTTFVWPADLH